MVGLGRLAGSTRSWGCGGKVDQGVAGDVGVFDPVEESFGGMWKVFLANPGGVFVERFVEMFGTEKWNVAVGQGERA